QGQLAALAGREVAPVDDSRSGDGLCSLRRRGRQRRIDHALDLAVRIAQFTGAVGQHVASRHPGGAGRVAAGPFKAETVGGILDEPGMEDGRGKSGRGSHPEKVSGLLSDFKMDSGKFPSRNLLRKMSE